MNKKLEHELSINSPYAQETHNARCVCGWVGTLRASVLTAQVDAKQHRIDTAVTDDVNAKKPKPVKAKRPGGKVAEGTIAEVQARGAKK